jgi:hypothetical protein
MGSVLCRETFRRRLLVTDGVQTTPRSRTNCHSCWVVRQHSSGVAPAHTFQLASAERWGHVDEHCRGGDNAGEDRLSTHAAITYCFPTHQYLRVPMQEANKTNLYRGSPVRSYVCFISGTLDHISVRYAKNARQVSFVLAVTCILEVVGSYLNRNTCYSEVLRRSPDSLQANSGFIPRLGHDSCLPNVLQFFIH